MSAVATKFLSYPAARQRMAEIIIEGSRDPQVVALALSIVRDLAQGDYASEAAALCGVARDGIRYTGDTSTEDLYKWPMVTAAQGAGDCNNKVILFGSLARAIGFPVQMLFLFAQAQPDFQNDFPVHVLAAVDVYKGERRKQAWYPCELVPMPDSLNGWPLYTLPFGTMRAPRNGFVDAVDVDQAAA